MAICTIPQTTGKLYNNNTLARKTHNINTSHNNRKQKTSQRAGESVYLAAALVASLVCLKNGIKSVPPVP